MHVRLRLVGDESFLEAVGNRAVIELLQRALKHTGFITDSDELVASLNAVEGDLTNDFIKALREELFADGADAVRARIQVLYLLV